MKLQLAFPKDIPHCVYYEKEQTLYILWKTNNEYITTRYSGIEYLASGAASKALNITRVKGVWTFSSREVINFFAPTDETLIGFYFMITKADLTNATATIQNIYTDPYSYVNTVVEKEPIEFIGLTSPEFRSGTTDKKKYKDMMVQRRKGDDIGSEDMADTPNFLGMIKQHTRREAAKYFSQQNGTFSITLPGAYSTFIPGMPVIFTQGGDLFQAIIGNVTITYEKVLHTQIVLASIHSYKTMLRVANSPAEQVLTTATIVPFTSPIKKGDGEEFDWRKIALKDGKKLLEYTAAQLKGLTTRELADTLHFPDNDQELATWVPNTFKPVGLDNFNYVVPRNIFGVTPVILSTKNDLTASYEAVRKKAFGNTLKMKAPFVMKRSTDPTINAINLAYFISEIQKHDEPFKSDWWDRAEPIKKIKYVGDMTT